MCGTLKYEGTSKRIGNLIAVIKEDGSTATAPWLGHHRIENSNKPINGVRVKLPAQEYTENHLHVVDRKKVKTPVSFSVPGNKEIDAWLAHSSTFPTGKGIFIVTRPATAEEKKKCNHPRHPNFTNKE